MWTLGTENGHLDVEHKVKTFVAILTFACLMFQFSPMNAAQDRLPYILIYSTIGNIAARLPQIVANYKVKILGAQSKSVYFLGVLGCLAKCVVVMGDMKALAVNAIAMFLNLTLLIQAYQMEKEEKDTKKKS